MKVMDLEAANRIIFGGKTWMKISQRGFIPAHISIHRISLNGTIPFTSDMCFKDTVLFRFLNSDSPTWIEDSSLCKTDVESGYRMLAGFLYDFSDYEKENILPQKCLSFDANRSLSAYQCKVSIPSIDQYEDSRREVLEAPEEDNFYHNILTTPMMQMLTRSVSEESYPALLSGEHIPSDRPARVFPYIVINPEMPVRFVSYDMRNRPVYCPDEQCSVQEFQSILSV